MNSCLYDCQIVHHRKKPKQHRFGYRVFMFYLDLDEIDGLAAKLPWMSRNKSNVYNFRDADHFQEGATDVKQNVLNFLAKHDLSERADKIYLLTHLRTWGHMFNPVSFYFVEDKSGNAVALIAEVANTFKEQKLYLVTNDKLKGNTYRDAQQKNFYISPFSNLDTFIHFKVKRPEKDLALSINETEDNEAFFFSSLQGSRRPLTQKSLTFYSFLLPAITLKIVAGIHWQALMLYLKKVPFRKKSLDPELQKEVRPYLKAH